MELKNRIKAFDKLGEVLRNVDDVNFLNALQKPFLREKALSLNALVQSVQYHNGWFTPSMVAHALKALGEGLYLEKLEKWLDPYDQSRFEPIQPKTVAVIMAGNVPAVGFHDFLSVLITGNKLLGKLSSEDDRLLPAIADVLMAIEPGFKPFIELTDQVISGFDVVIATGSNNSARYFEYYFGKYPSIIRKNRNGVAVLTGREEGEELERLADDVFLYYGLGCRNVAKLFVPRSYDFKPLLKVLEARKEMTDHQKYYNNYEYNKALYLVNKTPHFDTGNLLITESSSFSSPVSVLYYTFYDGEQALKNELMLSRDQIQCVVSSADFIENKVPFGQSQFPELWDYADGVDTIRFLTDLNQREK
jgi:hypothetical protein